MTLLSQTQCCALLGIDPKTLRNWLRRARMPFTAHPMDARLRCLTREQVEALATLHTRPVSDHCLTPICVVSQSCTSSESVPPQLGHDGLPLASPEPQTSEPEAPLFSKLVALETQVAALQEQVAHLTQELQNARQLRSEQRLGTLEALVLQMRGTGPVSQAFPQHPEAKPKPTSEPLPLADEPDRRPSRVLPLVEYTASGTYIILSPGEGELIIPPDSPEWFAWLETLPSFRFVGQSGSVSLSRNKPNQPSWRASCTRNGRRYDRGVGRTPQLTVAALEQIAATIQSSAPSH